MSQVHQKQIPEPTRSGQLNRGGTIWLQKGPRPGASCLLRKHCRYQWNSRFFHPRETLQAPMSWRKSDLVMKVRNNKEATKNMEWICCRSVKDIFPNVNLHIIQNFLTSTFIQLRKHITQRVDKHERKHEGKQCHASTIQHSTTVDRKLF